MITDGFQREKQINTERGITVESHSVVPLFNSSYTLILLAELLLVISTMEDLENEE